MERNRGGRPRHPDVLTPAEWRVLEALREGGTNAEIAARLDVSTNTVRYHVSNMLAKLELRDRRALAAWRPEGHRGRLGALFALPAAVWSVGRPLAWVGVGAAVLAGVVVVAVTLVALEALVERDPDPPAAVAPPLPGPETTPTQTWIPATTATPRATPSPTPSREGEPTPSPEGEDVRPPGEREEDDPNHPYLCVAARTYADLRAMVETTRIMAEDSSSPEPPMVGLNEIADRIEAELPEYSTDSDDGIIGNHTSSRVGFIAERMLDLAQSIRAGWEYIESAIARTERIEARVPPCEDGPHVTVVEFGILGPNTHILHCSTLGNDLPEATQCEAPGPDTRLTLRPTPTPLPTPKPLPARACTAEQKQGAVDVSDAFYYDGYILRPGRNGPGKYMFALPPLYRTDHPPPLVIEVPEGLEFNLHSRSPDWVLIRHPGGPYASGLWLKLHLYRGYEVDRHGERWAADQLDHVSESACVILD